MPSTETTAIRAGVALSALVVLIIAGLALAALLGNGDESTEPEPPSQDEADDGVADHRILAVDDTNIPLTADCRAATESPIGYAVVVVNRGRAAVDYLVSIRLEQEDGPAHDQLIEIEALAAGRSRTVNLEPIDQIGEVAACTIVAVESERRVLLANS